MIICSRGNLSNKPGVDQSQHVRAGLGGESPRREVHAVGDVRREPGLHDSGMRRRGVQVDRCIHGLGAREELLVGRVVEVAALAVSVDQPADEPQFGYRTLQFGRRGIGILCRQRGEAAESTRVGAHRLGEVVVGAPGEVDGVREVRFVLHTRIEQRQDLKVDSRGVHLLEAKRTPVVQPLVGNVVVGSQPRGDDVALTGRVPGVMLLERDQHLAPPGSVRHQMHAPSVHALRKAYGASCRGVRALACFGDGDHLDADWQHPWRSRRQGRAAQFGGDRAHRLGGLGDGHRAHCLRRCATRRRLPRRRTSWRSARRPAADETLPGSGHPPRSRGSFASGANTVLAPFRRAAPMIPPTRRTRRAAASAHHPARRADQPRSQRSASLAGRRSPRPVGRVRRRTVRCPLHALRPARRPNRRSNTARRHG